jgi:predicted Zn-dependent protease
MSYGEEPDRVHNPIILTHRSTQPSFPPPGHRLCSTPSSRLAQTLLAHELGHVRSKHSTGTARATEIRGARTDGGQQSRLRIAGQQFKPDEEAEADQAAAGLMTTVWRGSNVGCLATADLYEDVAKDRRRWGGWLSRHPFPERRVAAVAQACEAEQRRAR